MKKNLILAAFALTSTIGFAAGNTASATAVAKAKIRKAITIARTADLDFGGIVITAAGSGSDTATVDAQTGGVSTTVANGTIVGTFNSPAAASFNVGGTKNATYAVTVPSAAVVLTGSNGGTLNATAFTFWSATVGSAATGTLNNAAGTDTLTVGATLTIPQTTTDGDYLSGNFTVTVAYN